MAKSEKKPPNKIIAHSDDTIVQKIIAKKNIKQIQIFMWNFMFVIAILFVGNVHNN